MKKAFGSAFVVLFLLVPLLSSAHASIVTILQTFAFINNRPSDDIFGLTGVNLNVDLNAADNAGTGALTGPGASITATANNPSFPLSNPFNLPFNGFIPVPGGVEFTSIRSVGANPLSDFTGTYTINVKDTLGATAAAITHSLENLEVIPLPTNLAVNNHSLTPTFTFTDPNPTPGSNNLIRRYDLFIFDSAKLNIYQSPNSLTPSFAIPSGVLQPGQLYYFRAQSFDLDTNENNALESRSDTFLQVTTVPEPASLFLLASGVAGLGGITWRRHRRK